MEDEDRKVRKESMQLEVKKLEWKETVRGLSTHNTVGHGGEGSRERTMVRGLQLIPLFDEQKVVERFASFEKARESVSRKLGWSSGQKA